MEGYYTPPSIFQHPKLNPSDKLVYSALLAHGNIGYVNLAELTGLCKNSVYHSVKQLKSIKAIKVKKRGVGEYHKITCLCK